MVRIGLMNIRKHGLFADIQFSLYNLRWPHAGRKIPLWNAFPTFI